VAEHAHLHGLAIAKGPDVELRRLDLDPTALSPSPLATADEHLIAHVDDLASKR
jgi:hypothetical protein